MNIQNHLKFVDYSVGAGIYDIAVIKVNVFSNFIYIRTIQRIRLTPNS